MHNIRNEYFLIYINFDTVFKHNNMTKDFEDNEEKNKHKLVKRNNNSNSTKEELSDDQNISPKKLIIKKKEDSGRIKLKSKETSENEKPEDFSQKKEFKSYGKKIVKPGIMKQKQNKFNSEETEDSIRLNRYIANSGVCSRRDADELIESGKVIVNGKIVIELGTKISVDDKVSINKKVIDNQKKVYILMNKPKNTITSVKDEEGRKTVMDLINSNVGIRVYPVGRLDRNTTGVLLLTNDGELTKQLTHPKYNKKKIYHVFLDKDVTKADLEKLVEGIELEDGLMSFDGAAHASQSNKSEVGVDLHSGKNRIVRRMFEHLGYEVIKLDRVYFAGLTKKGIKRGGWRYLEDKEISMLKSGGYQ